MCFSGKGRAVSTDDLKRPTETAKQEEIPGVGFSWLYRK